MQNDNAWQIKSYNSEHNKCSWNYNNSTLKSGWIGKTFMKKFKDNPKLGTSEFRNELCTTLKANVSKWQAYRAKKKAMDLMQGKMEEQFNKIWDYCEEIMRSNPGSTVRMKLINEEGGERKRFQRFYMCFNAYKMGFTNGCRPVVGVDGCFLKGRHGGQLLSAVGLDANNNIYPIAYAIVESETKDSWMWFLRLLDRDLGFENDHNWTFMSDKQKGLIPAFEALFPNAENRFCVRHLHSNMKRDGFTGLALKQAMWAAARACRIEEFERKMEAIKNIDEDAYNWLSKKPPQNWNRAYFSTYPKCDILLNNMCECFNSFILDAREKPIISLLETLRNLLMARMQMNREKAKKWEGVICPNIKKILFKIEKEAGECIPMRSDEWNFQIVGPFDQHTVNVLQRTCNCRKWDLSGIPCRHAVSAIWCRNEEPEAYVHTCYTIEAYKKCYEYPIFGMNSSDLWPRSMNEPPLPPLYKEKIGRPQKLRRREPDEPPAAAFNPFRLVGVKRKNKCRSCGETSHNSATCKKRRFDNRDTGTETAATPTEASQSQQPDAPQFSSLPTQASASNEHPENRGTRQKLPVRMPRKNKQTKPTRSTRIASVKINQSTSNVHTPVIVSGGMNFITLSNLRASFSNVATGNTSRVASEMPPGVSRNTSRVPSGSSRASQSSQQG